MTAPFTNLAYLKYDPKLFRHPKIKLFAKYLGCHERDAFYWWMGMLSFCGLYSTEGDLSKYPLDEVCEFIDYDGDQELLVKAGSEAKLLDVDAQVDPSLDPSSEGYLGGYYKISVHNWPEWYADVLESRQNPEAQKLSGQKGGHTKNHVKRGIVKPGCPLCDAAVASPEGATWAPYVGSVGKEEKSREKESRVGDPDDPES